MFQDARDLQILFLTSFLVLGIGTRDWTLRPELVLVAIATCLLTQALAATYWPKFQTPESSGISLSLSLRSALITALGLSLLLRVDHWYTMAIASAQLNICRPAWIQIEERGNNRRWTAPNGNSSTMHKPMMVPWAICMEW